MTSVLALRSAAKAFSTVQALRGVDLELAPGVVHALLGENGAGKSTAVRLLAGLDRPDRGDVVLDGRPVRLASRADAIRRGVGLVPQTDSLVGELDLVQNLMLTQPPRVLRRRRAAATLAEVAESAGIAIDLTTPARELGRAQRQLGELTLALAQGARVLLLDEPTSALGPLEIGQLFTRVRALAAAGVAVLLVTHRPAEVRAVADRASVLSHGEVVWHGAVSDVDNATIAHAMVGDLPPAPAREPSVRAEPPALTLTGVTAVSGDRVPVRDVDLAVRPGEVVAVIGVAGNGQRALADVAAGVTRPRAGPRNARGPVAYVPETRSEGLLPDLAAKWSAVLNRVAEPRFSRFGRLTPAAVTRFAAELFERYDVRPRTPGVPVSALSGGNQQKLLVGREFDIAPAVAVLHGPTQGLDLRAAQAVREVILRAAEAGTAVLLVSADLDEVRALADRVLVLDAGRIRDEISAADFPSLAKRWLAAESDAAPG